MSSGQQLRDARSPDEVVGIDVGATKTHVATATAGVITFEQIVATSNWRTGSAPADAQALTAVVIGLLGRSALTLPLGLGAHGCDTTQQCLVMADELRKSFLGPITVVNDAELLPLALGISNGIGLVAGTGSIAAVRDENGQLLTAGGWGWVLGDEGSAAGIVREAVRAVLTQMDRQQPRDALATRLMSSWRVNEGPELAMRLTRTNSAEIWGRHAPEVFAAAQEGSVLAQAVISEAGEALATLVQRLAARHGRADHVVAAGAVISAQRSLWDSFVASMEKAVPRMAVTLLDRAPVLGAIRLATSLSAVEATDRRIAP
jgi:N-acetylglucosamine kinase-like BadF-type ATPase